MPPREISKLVRATTAPPWLHSRTPMLSSPVAEHRRALGDVSNSSPAPGTLTKAKTNHTSEHTRLYRGTGTITVQTPKKSTHWLLAPSPKKSVKKPEEHQTAADTEEMPQWLTEAESILAGPRLRSESKVSSGGDDATSRVALSWLGAGACDSASTRASLCLAEVRSATAERALQGAEERSLRAEVSALQARQAELEVRGEAEAARREAEAVRRERRQADEARAKAEAALVLTTSRLEHAAQRAEQRAEEAALQQQAQARAAAEAEREHDTALEILASEQSRRAALEQAKAGLERSLLAKSQALLTLTLTLALALALALALTLNLTLTLTLTLTLNPNPKHVTGAPRGHGRAGGAARCAAPAARLHRAHLAAGGRGARGRRGAPRQRCR